MLAARKMSSDTFFFTERKQLLSETLKVLARRKTVHGLCSIYHGLEADVYKFVYLERKTAVKITTSTRKDGNSLWPRLKHKNVLRMLETFSLIVLDTPVTVYVMPYKERCLAGVIGAKRFGLQHGDYPRIKKWLGQVLSGLKYLHSKELCHLNVMIDNVVFTSKGRAQLCDFDSLSKVGDPIEWSSIGLPWWFQPPDTKVHGCETDLWSYGLLVIDCATKLTLANGELTPERSWRLDVLPRLRRILQTQEFSRLVRRAYPATDIPDKDLLRALDFVHGFLQTDHEKRTTAACAKGHPFLGGPRRKWIAVASDLIWEDLRDASENSSTSRISGEAAEDNAGDGCQQSRAPSSLDAASDARDESLPRQDSFISGDEITEKSWITSWETISEEHDKPVVPYADSAMYRVIEDFGSARTQEFSVEVDSVDSDKPIKQVSQARSFIYAGKTTSDDVGYQPVKASSLKGVSDGLVEPVKLDRRAVSFTYRVEDDVTHRQRRTPRLDVVPDAPDKPIEPHTDFSIYSFKITLEDVGYKHSLKDSCDGLDEPNKAASPVDSSNYVVGIAKKNRLPPMEGIPIEPDKSIEQVSHVDSPIYGIAQNDVAYLQTEISSISEVVPDELIGNVQNFSTPDAVISTRDGNFEQTPDIVSEETATEPMIEQVISDETELITEQSTAIVVQFLNDVIAKATEELRVESSRLKESEGRISGVRECGMEPLSEPELKADEGIVAADASCQGPSDDAQESAESEEYSYFNLRSLSLSSRFNSSDEARNTRNQEGTRFQELRKAFSRVAGYISLKKKTTEERLLS